MIPERADQRADRTRRGPAGPGADQPDPARTSGGRPPAFDRGAYKQRNTVERCMCATLKQWRGIATRYEKTATIYLTGLHVAGIFLRSAR